MELKLEEWINLGAGMVKKPKYSEDIEFGNVYINEDTSMYVIVHKNGDKTFWAMSEGMKFIENNGGK